MDGCVSGFKGKLWLCSRGGHALGLVLRESVNGVMANRLLLFRNAVDVADAAAGEDGTLTLTAETLTVLIGEAEDIECDICAARRTWEMDSKLAVYLLAPLYGEKVKHG